jgi:hypothetical protein
VVEKLARESDQGGDVLGRCEAFGGVDFPGLRGKKHLAWLHANVYALDAAETEVAAWAVKHDCAAAIHHMCLEENLVDVSIVVDNVEFGWGQVESPIAEVLVYDVDSVVLECGVETCTFEDLA